jgi:ATP-dependent DNA helicase RecQ
MLREQGIFALEGVGPLSGRQLVESGITQIDDLQTAVPERIASETQFSVDQVEELQQAARDERYESLDADTSELTDYLIKTYSTAFTDKRITRNRANELLAQSVGHQAEFRPQQWEAIDKLANERDQLLLVQRTGWGKSTVYFIATKAIRNDGGGPTLIISPLLSLMRDQIKNAEEELGLSARTINSRNEDDWEQIYEDIIEGDCDLVLVSPERLGNQEFRDQVLGQMDDGFGMLVVDEAHCISDWGHDFRPDYQRVTRILDRLPSNVPVAATTATANDRVVDDITTQLPGLEPIRGNLVRDSLRIQAINMGDRQKRLAWLAENLPEGDRAGIVYCLTIDDVTRVTEWLSKKGYNVNSYHGRLDTDKRQEREQMLLNNDVDALVATNALGMGFDKPDLKYVIHFQRPQNLIRYYQEIGRAGRDLDTADAVVLSGSDDDETAEYFIESSFPSASNFEAVLETISDAEEPLSKWDLRIESDASQVSRCVQMLEVDGALERTDEGYVRTANQWTYDEDKYNRITEQRYTELERIQEFMRTDQCLTLFIDEQLDGQMSEPCGRCANCTGNFYPQTVTDQSLIDEAVKHYQSSGIETISNRVYRYLESGGREKIPPENQLETGRSLSVYEEPGWGTAVREGKYETGQFEESLVTGAVDMIENKWDPSPAPTWITYVPSESNEGLVADYASRLADELGLEIVDCVQKVDDTVPQKELSGSAEKCDNVRGAFEITDDVRSGPVLLIDDIVASRWTLTEVGRQLSKSGSGSVYPFALAKRRG